MSEGTTIGQSVMINGELRAEEDLTIEGRVEGKVELDQNVVTVGPDGRVTAEVIAKAVVVQGTVNGDIMATEKITLQNSATVHGDLTAPAVAIADGAQFQGGIDMQRSQEPKAVLSKPA